MKTILVSKFQLAYHVGGPIREIAIEVPPIISRRFVPALVQLLRRTKSADAVFASNPRLPELVYLYLARKVCGARLRIFVFDLIMRAPQRMTERILSLPKRKMLTAIDFFLFIHRDISGYERHFAVRRERCIYVPFKANNLDLVDKITPCDGNYVLALGASQRDYRLLVNAVTNLDVKLKLLLPRESMQKHNAVLGGELPANVEHIDSVVDRMTWNRYIAGSRMVVVPLLPGVVQPAGISVYLEAMAFGKPVVITRGSSTEGILGDDLAVLVEPGNVTQLRAAIWSLWRDPEQRRRLSVRSKAYAQSLGDHARLLNDIRSIINDRMLEQRC